METIITEKMVFGGDCLAKIEGKNVFVPFALPGEKLEVEIVESKKDYDIAKIVNIIEPSQKRIKPVCEYYTKCGGCNLMHIDYDYQVELRKQILADCFKRNKIEVPEIDFIAGDSLNYRARFQLHDGCLEAKRSNEKIFIKNCAVAEEAINEYLGKTNPDQRPRGRCHLFGSSHATPDFTIAIPPEKQKAPEPKNKKIKHYIRPKYQGINIDPSTCVSVKILDKQIMFDVQGFFQSNLQVLEKAIQLAVEDLSGKNALDMYSGCGTFSVFLADKFEKVTLVEHNRAAIVFAEQNLTGKNHDSYGISGAKWVKDNSASILSKIGNFDAVVIDPPRSGMEKEVLNFLCTVKPPVLRVISCDPVTNARDIRCLIDAGYKLKKLYLLDFYPQTSHIESLCFLEI
ncbi:MAG: methyltransferase [Treponema sp.]|uniref:class I SAM-dependent RNA methyltransferase n=1 Tax=Treponema sp. TaxID=166 RepID=UPI00298D603A|nr:TRAM domain-containing protein [Treponema sp.]MCQ2600108.1 methyltransferase [Treponema sp.]